MNAISVGKYCYYEKKVPRCPCLVEDFCGLFGRKIDKVGTSRERYVRLRECIEAKPRIVLGGLKYVEKSGRRYFFESHVINYLWGRYIRDKSE